MPNREMTRGQGLVVWVLAVATSWGACGESKKGLPGSGGSSATGGARSGGAIGATGGAGAGGALGTGGSSSGGSSGTGGAAGSGATNGGTSGASDVGGAGGGGSGGAAGGASGSAGRAGTGGVGGAAGAAGGVTGTAGSGAAGQRRTWGSAHQWYGRWNEKGTAGGTTVNSGSHVTTTFGGTGLTAYFDTSMNLASSMPTLAWQVDGGPWQEDDLAATVSLASGLAAGTHTVTLMMRSMDETQSRWGAPLVSAAIFRGVAVTGGNLEQTYRPLRPWIEFLGDDITEGVNVWTSHNGQTRRAWRNDARIAYPSQTAQMLGAEWRQVGFAGQGILKAGNGGVPKANDAFNWLYQLNPRDPWQPDMVVINQGTNDSDADASTFQAGYTEYMTTIRTAYPNAKIVALRPFNGSQAAPIKAAVDARVAGGDPRTYYVDSNGWLGSSDYTDGVHPNEQGSGKAARALVTALQQIGLP